MSESRVIVALERIASAPVGSPILIHRTKAPGCVGAVFAETSETRRLLAAGRYAAGGESALVGVWDRGDWQGDWKSIKAAVKAAAA
jgi:hypothetical protein